MKISHRKKRLYLWRSIIVIFILIFIFIVVYILYNFKEQLFSDIVIPLLCSFLFFVLLNFVIHPRIRLGKEIRKVVKGNDNYFFEYTVRNPSFFLELKNISVFYIIDTPYNQSQNYHSSKDKLVFEAIGCIPYISCDSDEFLNIIIRYEDIEEYLKNKSDTYNHVLKKISPQKHKVIGIDLFLDKPECTFQIVIHGYSGFTGVKKTYFSKPYKKEDIKIGDGWDHGKVSNCAMNQFEQT